MPGLTRATTDAFPFSHDQQLSKKRPPRRKASNQNGTDMSDADIFADVMDFDSSPLSPNGDAAHTLIPLQETADRVGYEVEQFAEKLDQWRSSTKASTAPDSDAALDFVNECGAIAQSTLDHLEANFDGAVPPYDHGAQQETDLWQDEVNTWKLLLKVLGSGYAGTQSNTAKEDLDFDDANDRFTADGQSFKHFIKNDKEGRARYMIIKWLEETADLTIGGMPTPEFIAQNEDETDSASQGWLQSREQIKNKKRLRPWDTNIRSYIPDIYAKTSGEPLINQLDPDAPSRSGLALDDSDAALENSFWSTCWEMLRKGLPLDVIRSCCEARNEHILPFIMATYPVGEESSQLAPSIETRHRWRKACLEAARHGGPNLHERAVFGLLGGDLRSVERVSKTWEDFLFARYNALLLAQYGAHLRKTFPDFIPPASTYRFGDQDSLDVRRTGQDILSALQSDPSSRLDTTNIFRVIQSRILCHNLQDFMIQHGTAISQKSSQNQSNDMSELAYASGVSRGSEIELRTSLKENVSALRFAAHAFIVLHSLRVSFGGPEAEQAAQNVLIAYIQTLLRAGKIDLIPLYASYLSQRMSVLTMAKVITVLLDKEQRMDYIDLMNRYNMDAMGVLETQYDLALRENPLLARDEPTWNLLEPRREEGAPLRAISHRSDDNVTKGEEMVLMSVQLFTRIDGFWFQTFKAMIDAAERLLASGRMHAAAMLFKQNPRNQVSLSKSKQCLNLDQGVDIMNFSDTDVQQVAKALAKQNVHGDIDSRELLEVMKLQAGPYFILGQLAEALSSLWKAQEAIEVHSGKTRTKSEAQMRVGKLESHVMPLRKSLKFLLSDFWSVTTYGTRLVTSQQQILAVQERERQRLDKIRRAYMPELLLAYVHALFFLGKEKSRISEVFLDAMDVADRIAQSEELTRCIVEAGRMREYVDTFAIVSKEILRHQENNSSASKRWKNSMTFDIWNVDRSARRSSNTVGKEQKINGK